MCLTLEDGQYNQNMYHVLIGLIKLLWILYTLMTQWLMYLMDFDSVTGYILNLQPTHYSKLSMENFTYF